MSARVLLLGGIDPSGGAGITVDATVCALHGAEPLPVALATTVQGRRGFIASHAIAPEVWREQIATVCADGRLAAVKVGFVGSAEVVPLLAEALSMVRGDTPVVVDPVLSATAGGLREPPGLVHAYRTHLLPRTTLLTPNAPEFEAFGGQLATLRAAGARAVLRKGGHVEGADAVDELFVGEEPPYRFARTRYDCGPVRGTGCALASAIAAHLAAGCELVDACRRAGDWLAGLLARVRPTPSGLPRNLPLRG